MAQDDETRLKLVSLAKPAIGLLEQYLKGEEIDEKKAAVATKMVNVATRVLHMNQVRTLTERSQAIRLLPWLEDAKARQEYMKLTDPIAGQFLLSRPKPKK